jgi:5-methylcytosine-specific restriction endonuclease McrA
MTNNNDKICIVCGVKFIGRMARKFCSQSCASVTRTPGLIERNKARRKYEDIPGFNRFQICRFHNPEKEKREKIRDDGYRIEVIKFLGGKCSLCGYEKDFRALQLDHKNSDGHLDRKKPGRKGKISRYYVKNLDEAKEKLQILCANCNKIKQIESKEYNLTPKIRINDKIQLALKRKK